MLQKLLYSQDIALTIHTTQRLKTKGREAPERLRSRRRLEKVATRRFSANNRNKVITMTRRSLIGALIVGGTGYGAGELLRLLSTHPAIEVAGVVSASASDDPISKAHPHLRSLYDGKMIAKLNPELLTAYERGVIFTALPHGVSGVTVAQIIKGGLREHVSVIDLSGDLRLTDPDLHQKHYSQCPFDSQMRSQFVYGLPELYREAITKSRFITNPGCLATAAILSVAPLMSSSFSGSVIFDAKTGTSGAGRTPQATFHHPVMHADAYPYKIMEHRHEPEIRQILGDPQGERIRTVFVPHVIPVSRGIMLTAYLSLQEPASREALLKLYRAFYKDSPFMRIIDEAPHLAPVVGSNYCDLSIFARDNEVVVSLALDNLLKGMAGAAIQNLNLMSGLPETMGLSAPGLGII